MLGAHSFGVEYLSEGGEIDRLLSAQHVGHALDLVDEVDVLLVAGHKKKKKTHKSAHRVARGEDRSFKAPQRDEEWGRRERVLARDLRQSAFQEFDPFVLVQQAVRVLIEQSEELFQEDLRQIS